MDSAAEINIRPAVDGEMAQLSELALRSKGYWGYSRSFLEACRAELTFDGNYLAENHIFVLEVGGQTIGFYSLEPLRGSDAELGALFVEPSHIGLGYGRRLIDHARDEARRLGFSGIVIQGDPNAVGFYLAAGGVPFGERESSSIPGRSLPLFRIPLEPR